MALSSDYGGFKDRLYSAVLADTLDSLGHRFSVLPPRIRPLVPKWRILGSAVTLSMVPVATEPESPYLVEMECIDGLQPGDVLVATSNGDRSSALWGELLSTACRARQVEGAVMDALTRDVEKIIDLDFPVFAAGMTPLDSKGRLDGVHFNQPIRVGACVVHPGDWVFGDIVGVVVIPQALAEETFAKALEKVNSENLVRRDLAAGRSVKETFAKYGIL